MTDSLTKVTSSDYNGAHLLLGNGFMRALNNDFSYQSLCNNNITSDKDWNEVFQSFETYNFEEVMLHLANTEKLLQTNKYKNSTLTDKKLAGDITKLQSLLIDAIKNAHSNLEIPVGQPIELKYPNFVCHINTHFRETIKTLSKFKNIFTLNYDLITYYLSCFFNTKFGFELNIDDGFVGEYLWDPWERNEQSLFYLHGGLHLYNDDKNDVRKLSFKGNKNAVDVVEKSIQDNFMPLIVTEPSYERKVAKIKGNRYLDYCYRNLLDITGTLFVYGFSFGDMDKHVVDAIVKASKQKKNKGVSENEDANYKPVLSKLYVGVFDDNSPNCVQQFIAIVRQQLIGFEGEITFFDVADLNFWK